MIVLCFQLHFDGEKIAYCWLGFFSVFNYNYFNKMFNTAWIY